MNCASPKTHYSVLVGRGATMIRHFSSILFCIPLNDDNFLLLFSTHAALCFSHGVSSLLQTLGLYQDGAFSFRNVRIPYHLMQNRKINRINNLEMVFSAFTRMLFIRIQDIPHFFNDSIKYRDVGK